MGSAPDAQGFLHAFVQQFDSSLNEGNSFTISGSNMETGSGVAFDPNSGNAYIIGTVSGSFN